MKIKESKFNQGFTPTPIVDGFFPKVGKLIIKLGRFLGRYLNPWVKIFKRRNPRLVWGFTMVELIVAMSVFSVAITMASGVFVRALRTQRMLNNLMSVNSNASLVIEQLAREIRTGHTFEVSSDGGADCDNILTFNRSADNTLVSYKWNTEKNSIDFKKEGETDFSALTASNILVKKFCFVKIQAETKDPWRIMMHMAIGSTNPQLKNNFLNIQTTISSRVLPSDIQ